MSTFIRIKQNNMAFTFLNDLDMGGSDGGSLAAASQFYQPSQQQQAVAPQQPLTSYNSHQAVQGHAYGSSGHNSGGNNHQPDALELFLMETRKILQSNYTQCARIEYENKKQKEQNEKLEKRLQTILYIMIALFVICFIMAIILCWTCYQAAATASNSRAIPHHHLPGYTRSWATSS
jgi:hypothetical protein